MKRKSGGKQRILKKDSHSALLDDAVNEDFIFRFDLSTQEERPVHEDPIVEMVREQLHNILNVVVLTSEDRELKVNGFKFLNNMGVIYEIFRREQSPKV